MVIWLSRSFATWQIQSPSDRIWPVSGGTYRIWWWRIDNIGWLLAAATAMYSETMSCHCTDLFATLMVMYDICSFCHWSNWIDCRFCKGSIIAVYSGSSQTKIKNNNSRILNRFTIMQHNWFDSRYLSLVCVHFDVYCVHTSVNRSGMSSQRWHIPTQYRRRFIRQLFDSFQCLANVIERFSM